MFTILHLSIAQEEGCSMKLISQMKKWLVGEALGLLVRKGCWFEAPLALFSPDH